MTRQEREWFVACSWNLVRCELKSNCQPTISWRDEIVPPHSSGNFKWLPFFVVESVFSHFKIEFMLKLSSTTTLMLVCGMIVQSLKRPFLLARGWRRRYWLCVQWWIWYLTVFISNQYCGIYFKIFGSTKSYFSALYLLQNHAWINEVKCNKFKRKRRHYQCGRRACNEVIRFGLLGVPMDDLDQ